MREDVYDFLREYGFSKEEINFFEKKNEKMFFTDLKEVNKNITFLNDKGLSKEEIMHVFKNNAFMITVKDNRLKMLDRLYVEEIRLDVDSLKKLILNNPETYTISPIELQKIIEYLKECNCNIEVIRNFIMSHPKVISMKFTEFKEIVKFV